MIKKDRNVFSDIWMILGNIDFGLIAKAEVIFQAVDQYLSRQMSKLAY